MKLEKFLVELCKIFEIKKIDKNLKITNHKNWDSLTALSILSLIDTNFKKSKINLTKIEKFKSIQQLYDYLSKKK